MDKIANLFKQAMGVLCVPVHAAGWPFIAIFAVVSIFLAMIDDSLGFIGLILTAWCVYFFRNPDRQVPDRKGLLVSPADGIVSMITKSPLPPELDIPNDSKDPLFSGKDVTRISIFLNVFDVHVNRAPIAGSITQVVYQPGKFLNAGDAAASDENERNTLVIAMDGYTSSVAFSQITGLVARRILCDAKEGDVLKTGERYGIIRFGSRVDIYLPPKAVPMVSIGQRMIGGETVIADMASKEKPRKSKTV